MIDIPLNSHPKAAIRPGQRPYTGDGMLISAAATHDRHGARHSTAQYKGVGSMVPWPWTSIVFQHPAQILTK